MTPESLNARLDNYRDLVFRVDEMCRRIEETLGPEVTCTRGCDGCCRHFSLFPVEAVALAAALQNLPSPEVDRIRVRARVPARRVVSPAGRALLPPLPGTPPYLPDPRPAPAGEPGRRTAGGVLSPQFQGSVVPAGIRRDRSRPAQRNPCRCQPPVRHPVRAHLFFAGTVHHRRGAAS